MERMGLAKAGLSPSIKVRTGADVFAEIATTFPHYELLERQTSIDPHAIYYTLIKQRLNMRDAVIHMGPYCFPLVEMVDTNASEMKRFKKGSPEKTLPDRSGATAIKPPSKLVSKKSISRVYRHLNPKKERACDNTIVVKGTVISLVRTLNSVLTESGASDINSDFDRPGNRYQTIADWLNWVFKRNYNLDTKYTCDQVRQMLKRKTKSDSENKNKYGGRFTTPLIDF